MTKVNIGDAQTLPIHEEYRHWSASWITSGDVSVHDESFVHFQKTISIKHLPDSLPVFVSADNQFQLRVNGKLVGWGPSVSDVSHWRYETYDLAPFLVPGENTIAATVWHLVEHAPFRQMGDSLGFVLDCDACDALGLRTDASWKVEIERGLTAIEAPPDVKAKYYVSSPGERFVGTQLDWGWSGPAGSGNGWKSAKIAGRATARGSAFADTPWQLTPDNLPSMERTRRSIGKLVRLTGLSEGGSFPDSPLTVPAHRTVKLLIDSGQVMTAFPEFVVSGGRGAKMSATYTEALTDAKGSKGNRNEISDKSARGVMDEFLTEGGSHRVYAPVDWRAWRYLEVAIATGDDPLTLDSVQAWFTGFPFHQIGSFGSDNPELGRIWQTGWNTLRVCAHDTYMDTPYWERLQYVGDTRIQALITYVVTGDERLPRQAINAFHDSIFSEGITQSRYPTRDFQAITGFSLYYIGMVHDYSMYRDDPAFLRTQMSAVRSTLDFFRARLNTNNLLGNLPWWPFVDWGFPSGVPPMTTSGDSAVLSLQLVEALRYAADLEDQVGMQELALADRAEADQIAHAVYELCWSASRGLIADTPDKTHFSQQANAYAVWLDVVPKAAQADVMEKVFASPTASFGAANEAPERLTQASFYYRFYLARALFHAGLGNRYIDTLEPWRAMLANGLTTWAETPEPTRSDSHAWSAHPTYDLLSSVAGIMPGSAGYRTVRIEPQLGRIKHIDAVAASPKGAIRVQLDVTSSGIIGFVDLPAELSGSFVWNGKAIALTSGRTPLNLRSASQ